MTEPELITQLVADGVDARAVLQWLAQYAGANADVTLNLSNGATVTLPGVPKQRAQFSTDFANMKLAITQDFGGAVASQTVARNSVNVITSVRTVFTSGYQLQHDYARNAAGQITTVTVNVYDSLNNVLATAVKNINRANGLYSGIN